MDKNYTQQLSLWKHRVIKRYVQEELKRQVDQQALVLAKARLQQCITDEMRLTRKLRIRQGMTRWWNAQVTTWINESAHKAAQTSIDAPHEGDREVTEEQASLGSSSEAKMGIPHDPSSSAGIADLSASLGDIQQGQVFLLPDNNSEQGQHSPFAPFPPLSKEERTSLGKQQRVQRATNNAKRHTSKKKELSSTTREGQEDQGRPFETEQQKQTNELPSTHTQELTPSIHERQQSFGIHIRSTYWR